MRNYFIFGTILLAASMLAGCGGGGGGAAVGTGAQNNLTRTVTDVPIPNWTATNNGAGSFDLVYVDQVNHTANFTDRNNKSIDQIVYASQAQAALANQFSAGLGFTGCTSAVGVAAPGCPATAPPPIANTGTSGPNGIHGLPGSSTTAVVGDVNKIVVMNVASGALIASIAATNPVKASNIGFRTDEGCVLPGSQTPAPLAGVAIAAFSNTSEGTNTIGGATRGLTFYTFVRLDTNVVIGQMVMPNSAGQELCRFDASAATVALYGSPIMYYTDDGDILGPAAAPINTITGAGGGLDGSMDSFNVKNLLTAFAAATAGVNGNKTIVLDLTANVAADTVTGFYPAGTTAAGATLAAVDYRTTPATGIWHRVAAFDTVAPAVGCTPAGMAFNTTNNIDIAQSCRPGTIGNPLNLLIINRNTGALIAQPNAGGADQVEFDAVGNAYLAAASRWTASGLSPNSCSTAANRLCSPVLQIVDATTFAIRARVPTGNNAHGVDFDSSLGLAFLPHSNATQPVGCATCAANGFVNGGVQVVQFR